MSHTSLPALVAEFLRTHLAGLRADRALAGVLRANGQLSSEERGVTAAWTLGIALWRGRLDHFARGDIGLWLPLFLVDREHREPADAALLCGIDLARLRPGSSSATPSSRRMRPRPSP